MSENPLSLSNFSLLNNGAFTFYNLDNYKYPVLLSVPHAGRIYPSEIMDNLAVPASNLMRLEDRYADRLIVEAVAQGFGAIVAQKPRAWIDLNRDKSEIDPDMITGISATQLPAPSRKVRGGLGIVPRRLSGSGNLWRRKWSINDIHARIGNDHEPYHQAVSHILKQMRAKFGRALLLDIHSMPPLDKDLGAADIVIGDRFGRSAGSRYSELATSHFQQSGLKTRLNHPYAGGYILERHSRPEKGLHALQVEIDRSCYLQSDLLEPSQNLPVIASHIGKLAELLSNQITGQYMLAAAE